MGCGRINFESVERDGGGATDAPSDLRDTGVAIDARHIDAPALDGEAPLDAPLLADVPAIDAGPIAAPVPHRLITAVSPGIQTPTGIAIDPAGNIVVVGHTDTGLDYGTPFDGAGGEDGFVASFAADGAHRWSRLLGGPLDDQVWDVATDSAGNVFIAGRFSGTVDFGSGPVTAMGAQRDAYVVSYDQGGGFRWAKVWGSTDDDTAFGLAMVGGDVYMSGWFFETVDLGTGPLTAIDSQDVIAASFTNTGVPRFASAFGAAGIDQGQKIAVDPSARPVVGGLFSGSIDLGSGIVASAGARDGFVVAMDAAGAPRWSRTVGGVGGDEVTGIVTDPAGNVYVTGVFADTVDFGTGAVSAAGGTDGFVASYAADGAPRWAAPLAGAGFQLLYQVTYSPRGYVVAGGWFSDAFDSGSGTIPSAGGQDGVLVAHELGGRRAWTVHVGSAASESIRDIAVATDLYAVGSFWGTADYGLGEVTSEMADVFVLVLRSD